jgi:hypothetical protein
MSNVDLTLASAKVIWDLEGKVDPNLEDGGTLDNQAKLGGLIAIYLNFLQPMGKGAMESRNGDDKSQYEGG